MTEAEWLNATDPQPMLEFLRGKASERKLRLFACACCRRLWSSWEVAQTPESVLTSEQFADGMVSRDEMRQVKSKLGARGGYSAAWAANCAEFAVLEDEAEMAADGAVRSSLSFAYYDVYEQTFSTESYSGDKTKATDAAKTELKELIVVLRELFGNPFRPLSLDPAWQTSTVIALAEAAYDNRILPAASVEPDRLAILADALEDAGCTDSAILDHLRGPGPHVRGCFVIDALIGKK
jgi:hypothetical protein